jgi:thioredoxin-related protein
MKKIIFISTCFLALTGGILTAQTTTGSKDTLVWYNEFNTVYEISKTSNKPIFAFFTGSDWCGWCHKLQRDVFAKKEFIDWANKNVVLLELDFPKRKQLPANLAQQNSSLQQQFQVRGYPTIWMFFAAKDEATQGFSLTALGSLGYPQGAEPGKEEVKFLSDANLILANAKK